MATVLECYAPGPFALGAPVTLIDSQSLNNEVLPAGTIVTEVFAHADTAFSEAATIEVGWSGNAGALVGTGDLTTTTLNATDWHKAAATIAAPTADQALTVTMDPNLTVTGQVHLKLVCWQFANR